MSRCWSAEISDLSTNSTFKSLTVEVKSTGRENLFPLEHRTCTVTLLLLASTAASASSPIIRYIPSQKSNLLFPHASAYFPYLPTSPLPLVASPPSPFDGGL
jgi:hypothetical protein